MSSLIHVSFPRRAKISMCDPGDYCKMDSRLYPVVLICPSCRGALCLHIEVHTIHLDGLVSPSWKCTRPVFKDGPICTFHAKITLLNWSYA